MTTTIRITAQLYENYNFYPNGPTGSPYWKAKGGHEFIIKADEDLVMYAPNLKDILIDMVADQSNQHERFEYIDHELVFSKPTELSSEIFSTKVGNQFETH